MLIILCFSKFKEQSPNVVRNKIDGFLAPEKNVDELSRFIIDFYEMNEEKYNEFSINAKQNIEQNFDNENCSLELENL